MNNPRINTCESRTALLLAVMLLLACVVRLLGPLQHAALGQTDAYTHLQFLKDMVTNGQLRHSAYPPGYFWVLAVPTGLLNLDPYLVVRYAGTLFGCGLVASLYLLSRHAFGVRAALWTAFLVAACPAFYHLQKTGVGAYPSQLGLLLVPLLLLLWNNVISGRYRYGILLVLVSAMLAVSVPMMLFDTIPFLVIDYIVRLLRREVPHPVRQVCIAGIAGLAGGLALVKLLGGFEQAVKTIGFMAGLPWRDDSVLMNLFQAVFVYIQPRSLIPNGLVVQLGAASLGVLFAVLLWMLWSRGTAVRMLGMWGMFVWFQTVFGIMQFPLYMRAGWFLLMALAVLGGWAVVNLFDRLNPPSRKIAAGILVATAFLSVVNPPAPRSYLSAAENNVIEVLRELEHWSESGTFRLNEEMDRALRGEDNVLVWARAFNGFADNQGDPLYALLESNPRFMLHSVSSRWPAMMTFDPAITHVILLDDRVELDASLGLNTVVNPDLSAAFLRARAELVEGAASLRNSLEAATKKEGTMHLEMDEGLQVYLLQRRGDR